MIVAVNEFLKCKISHRFLNLWCLVLGNHNARMSWYKLIS